MRGVATRRIVSPEEFVAAFGEVVRRRKAEVASSWVNAKQYTRLFLDGGQGILQQAAQRLGLRYWTQWWNLDAIFYESADEAHFPAEWRVVKCLAVAIEHENVPGESPSEINKLSLINVPLKVLITYPGRSQDDALLSSYAEILGAADIFHDFASLRRQIVAFAFKRHEMISWRYHVYTDRGFVPVQS